MIARIGQALHGPEWRHKLAADLGIEYRHMRRLEKGEMVDGLGLAETTPGPLIMVVQFVGFLAAWRHGTGLSPLMAGCLGAVLTTWVTFVPCFYWIFLGAPYVEKLLHKPWLASALTAITGVFG